VIFQGDINATHFAEATRIVPDLLKSECVEFRPRINWEQAWQLLWQSDLLLLFQGTHELQVPAKFYEYLQTGIPILAVTEEGALTDILQATESGIWVKSDDPQAIADGLMRALEMPKRPREEISARLANRYHYRALAEQLSLWIRGLSSSASYKDRISRSGDD
jgi:glycosyltransferase involved in cell wall biosynthesis